VEAQAKKHKPKVIVVGASAYPREIPSEPFRQIADRVGAVVLFDIAHIAGLVAAGVHPNPVPLCEFVTTTTHKTLRGPRGGMILCKADYQKALDGRVFPGMQGGPLMHVIAAKAVALKEALTEEFRQYQRQIRDNARTLAETLMAEGFRLVSGGTDNHLMLIDVTSIGVTGAEGADALDRAGITANKNMIPFDTRGPQVTSGIRVGTPAITSRGMKEPEMKLVGRFISTVLKDLKNEATIRKVREEVRELCERFPLYAERIARG